MRPGLFGVIAAATIIASTAAAQGDVRCPAGPDQVNVTVRAAVSFDPATRLHTYSYAVSTAADSAQEVERFEVDAVKATDVGAPDGWLGSVGHDLRVVMWSAVDIDPAIANEVTNDASVPPSIANIKPGGSVWGFSFQSINPPGEVSYRAYGYAPVEFEGTDDDWEAYSEETADCPHAGREGLTTGPVAPLAGAPGAPGAPTFTEVVADGVTMHWTPPEGGADTYELPPASVIVQGAPATCERCPGPHARADECGSCGPSHSQ